MLAHVVFVLLALLTTAEQLPQTDGSVFILNDRNFDDFLKVRSHVVVVFVAPWCEKCAKAQKMIQQVAARVSDIGVVFAKVDATSTVAPDGDDTWASGMQTAHKYGVYSYPTFQMFHYGRLNEQFVIDRTSTELLTRQLELLVRLPSVELTSVEEVEAAIEENRLAIPIVIGFYTDNGAAAAFADLGETFRSMILFHHVERKEVCAHFNVTNNFVIVRPTNDDFVPTEGTPMGGETDGARGAATREVSSYLPRTKPRRVTQADRLRWIPKLTALSTEIVVYDGDDRRENVGQENFARDKMAAFVTLHGFHPIGILSELNRHIYNLRAPGMVMMFLENLKTPTSASGNINLKHQKQQQQQCSQGAASGCHDGVDDDDGDEDVPRGAKRAPSLAAPVASDVKYYANRFKRLLRHSHFQNYSFLFVDPNINEQIFAAFGFEKAQLLATEDDLRSFKAAGKQGTLSGNARNNLIGVLVGQYKYRYPHDVFDIEHIEKFLNDVNRDKVNPYVKSQVMDKKNPKPGEGKLFAIVHDNFEDIVSRDFERDTLVLFASSYDSLSHLAADNLKALAEKEKSNTKLVIGLFDAMYNDPPPFFEFSELPTLYFARAGDKRKFFGSRPRQPRGFGRSRAATPTASASTQQPKRQFRESHTRSSSSGGVDDETRFVPIEYAGDFSLESIAIFLANHASHAPFNTIVPQPDETKKYVPKGHAQGSSPSSSFPKQTEPGRVEDLYDAEGNYLGGGKRSYTFNPDDRHSDRIREEARKARERAK